MYKQNHPLIDSSKNELQDPPIDGKRRGVAVWLSASRRSYLVITARDQVLLDVDEVLTQEELRTLHTALNQYFQGK